MKKVERKRAPGFEFGPCPLARFGVTAEEQAMAASYLEVIDAGVCPTPEAMREVSALIDIALRCYVAEFGSNAGTAVKGNGVIVFWGDTSLHVDYRCAFCRQSAASYTPTDVARYSTLTAAEMLRLARQSTAHHDDRHYFAVREANKDCAREFEPKANAHAQRCALRYLAGLEDPTDPETTADLRHARTNPDETTE